jgi:hypothetical protein
MATEDGTNGVCCSGLGRIVLDADLKREDGDFAVHGPEASVFAFFDRVQSLYFTDSVMKVVQF